MATAKRKKKMTKREEEEHISQLKAELGEAQQRHAEQMTFKRQKTSTEKHLHDLPELVWKTIAPFLVIDDIINVSLTSEALLKLMKSTFGTRIDWSKRYPFRATNLHTLVPQMTTTLNLNNCNWISSQEVLSLLTNLTYIDHLHLINCNVDEQCVEKISKTKFKSLSICFTQHWLNYLKKKTAEPKPCFNNVENLELCDSYQGLGMRAPFLFDLFSLIFPHLNEVHHLKIFDVKNVKRYYQPYIQEIEIMLPATVWNYPFFPKLVNLEVNLSTRYGLNTGFQQLVKILSKHATSLQFAEFGIHTTQICEAKLMENFPLLPNKNTLTLRSDKIILNWIKEGKLENLLKIQYKTIIIMKDVKMWWLRCHLKEVPKNNCKTLNKFRIESNEITEVVHILSLIGAECKDLSILEVMLEDELLLEGKLLNYKIRKYRQLLVGLMKFTNLKVLKLSPNIFHCAYVLEGCDGSPTKVPKPAEAIPFESVTMALNMLTELRLINNHTGMTFRVPTVPVECLHAIKHCKDLQILHLSKFEIVSSEFNFSTIYKNCRSLQFFFLDNFSAISEKKLGNFLKHSKSLRTLRMSFMGEVKLNDPFVNSLCECKTLERIYLGKNTIVGTHKLRTIKELFNKLNRLYVLVYNEDMKIDADHAGQIIDFETSILQERPGLFIKAFHGDYRLSHVLPDVHSDLLV